MCRFIESIQLRDGVFKRLELHQPRLQKAMAAFYPNVPAIDLAEILKQSEYPTEGLFKCCIVYDSEIRQMDFSPYVRREIQTLRVVETDMASAPYKSEDRSALSAAFAKRGDCDDVLLVRNGLLTDSSYCNVALFDGESWITPRLPLIYGVNRAQLLSEGKLIEKDIKLDDLLNFQSICLFNAMIEFGEITIKTSSVYQ